MSGGLDWDTILGLRSYEWTPILLPILLGGLAWSAARPPHERAGWKELSPTVAVYLFLPLSVLIGLFSLVVEIVSVGAIMLGERDWKVFAIAGLFPIGVLAGTFLTWQITVVRIAFNDEGIERRVFGRRRFLPWSDVTAIRRSLTDSIVVYGPKGREFAIFEYMRGIAAFYETARARGIPVEV